MIKFIKGQKICEKWLKRDGERMEQLSHMNILHNNLSPNTQRNHVILSSSKAQQTFTDYLVS